MLNKSVHRKSKSAQKMFDSKPRKSKIGKYRKISIPNKFRKSRIRINRTRKGKLFLTTFSVLFKLIITV